MNRHQAFHSTFFVFRMHNFIWLPVKPFHPLIINGTFSECLIRNEMDFSFFFLEKLLNKDIETHEESYIEAEKNSSWKICFQTEHWILGHASHVYIYHKFHLYVYYIVKMQWWLDAWCSTLDVWIVLLLPWYVFYFFGTFLSFQFKSFSKQRTAIKCYYDWMEMWSLHINSKCFKDMGQALYTWKYIDLGCSCFSNKHKLIPKWHQNMQNYL